MNTRQVSGFISRHDFSSEVAKSVNAGITYPNRIEMRFRGSRNYALDLWGYQSEAVINSSIKQIAKFIDEYGTNNRFI